MKCLAMPHERRGRLVSVWSQDGPRGHCHDGDMGRGNEMEISKDLGAALESLVGNEATAFRRPIRRKSSPSCWWLLTSTRWPRNTDCRIAGLSSTHQFDVLPLRLWLSP
jgi:hypothetical protein